MGPRGGKEKRKRKKEKEKYYIYIYIYYLFIYLFYLSKLFTPSTRGGPVRPLNY